MRAVVSALGTPIMIGGGALLGVGYCLETRHAGRGTLLRVLAWIPTLIQAVGLMTIVLGAATVSGAPRSA